MWVHEPPLNKMKTHTIKVKRVSAWPQREMYGRDGLLNPNRAIADVAAVFGITAKDIQGRSRIERYTYPRHIYVYLLRRSGYALEEIGRLMSRDHGTALNSERRARDLLGYHKETIEKALELQKLGYKF